MAKLINLIPGRELRKESIEDMDTNLPAQMEKFLDRTINIIKSYNLPRKKEQLVIAKIIDSLGMDKQQLMQAISKIKKNDILKKQYMIKLKDILKETEEFQQLPTELKRHFLEIISTYNQHLSLIHI